MRFKTFTAVAALLVFAVPGIAAAAGVSVSAPSTADVGETVSITLTVTNPSDLFVGGTLSWGDGSVQIVVVSAGAHTFQHVYDEAGTYEITASIDDGTGSDTIVIAGHIGTFADDDGSIFESHIEWLAAEGITQGCNPPTNSLFCPDDNVTRGQMAAFLVRGLGLTDDGGGNHFVDDDGSIFEDHIAKLAAAGITLGCNPPTNDRFCPDDYVTRGQMAAFLVRGLGLTDDGGGNNFVDDDGTVFEDHIAKLAAAGITLGCNPPTNDRFCPYNNVTRGQMAAFLHRALG